MVPTPESSGSARSRNQTPPPRAKASAKATAKAETPPVAESTAASSAAPVVEQPNAEEVDKSFQGIEPPVWCAVLSGMVLGAFVFAIMFPDERVMAIWSGFQKPLQKLFVERADMLIAFAAMSTFAPLAALGLVTLCRVVSDLQYLNFWQSSVVGLTTSIAWGTLVLSEGPTRDFIIALPKNTVDFWDAWSNPIEKVLVDNSDNIVAGAALIALSPLALVVGVVVFRVVSCRGKSATDEKAKEETKLS